jgi:pyruvate,water dikinase
VSDGPWLLPLEECRDLPLAGGKAVNLARLLAAGFPVPDGFVLTTAAFRHAMAAGGVPAALRAAIAAAYGRMGSPPVAVRSSATAEDLPGASMAGQYVTVLNVRGESELLEAVEKCWASIQGARARAYLAEQGIDAARVAMAVVVQRLVPAEAAGVLFTANPRTGAREEMLLEASWGLGEAVVSGAVQPDTLVLGHHTGTVVSATIADKQVEITTAGGGPVAVPEPRRRIACLDSRQVYELWQLGVRVAALFGAPQDIEWAIHAGKLYLLQSRTITTLPDSAARDACLDRARQQLRQWRRAGRGDWVLHNIAETLPHPTPLTWSIIRRFMSGDGGFGAMYKMVGFQPAPTAAREGCLELIAGRIYLDLSRAPEMFFAGLPYRYDLDLLRTNPDAAQGPPTVPAGSLLALGRTGRKLAAVQRRLAELARDCDRRLDGEIIPAWLDYVRQEKRRELTRLDTLQWLDLWQERERRVLGEFAPQSLLPGLIAAMAMDALRRLVDEHCWDDDPQELANLLASGAWADQTLRASQGLYDLAHGSGTLEAWLGLYGHRAPGEFELAARRWRERPDDVLALAARLKTAASPAAMHTRQTADAAGRLAELAARLPASRQTELRQGVQLAQRYIRFREDGKHYLMLGYDLLRDMALEAGRRLGIAEDAFLLDFDELERALATGIAPLGLIVQRRAERAAEEKISLAHLITDSEIDSLGAPPAEHGQARTPAFPISAGARSGPVQIVLSPDEPRDLGQGYVLVCPSTDPSWTPLFVNAAAVVLERGGSLSHGAIVAREMGIPAVVCPGATQFLVPGETILVDGHQGAIVRQGAEGRVKPPDCVGGIAADDPADTRIPRRLAPPVPGRREHRGARLRNAMLLGWGVYLAAVFLLPQPWLYDPTMHLLDFVLWPVVRAWGNPAAVGVVAAVMALATMLGQRMLTDNKRLLAARRRAAQLRKLAAKLPPECPRRKAMRRLARPVQTRVMMAAMLPLAVILGPMVMSFLWLPARVDPAAWNAGPGATALVVAGIDGEFTRPVTLECDGVLMLDESTPAAQSLPPLRATLEARLAKWQGAGDAAAALPPGLQDLARLVGQSLQADLADYLAGRIPPQTLSWILYTPADQPGRFPIALRAEGTAPLGTRLVLGNAYPPEPKLDLGDGKRPVQWVQSADPASPIRWLKVSYAEAKTRGSDRFWTPLAAWGWGDWDTGWLLTYLAVYVPLMLVLRWCLRLA